MDRQESVGKGKKPFYFTILGSVARALGNETDKRFTVGKQFINSRDVQNACDKLNGE